MKQMALDIGLAPVPTLANFAVAGNEAAHGGRAVFLHAGGGAARGGLHQAEQAIALVEHDGDWAREVRS